MDFFSWIFISWWHCTNALYVIIYIVRAVMGAYKVYHTHEHNASVFMERRERGGIYHGDYFVYKTYSAFTTDWIWMLVLLLIWKSIVDDDGWKLLMLHILPFDVASEDEGVVVSTFFGSLMGDVKDSSPLESFSISAPNWWRAVIVEGVGSGMLFCNPTQNTHSIRRKAESERSSDKFIERQKWKKGQQKEE